MTTAKSHILAQLQREILPLQGYKHVAKDMVEAPSLGPINYAFPNSRFPLGAIHEFCYNLNEEAAATTGFITGLLSGIQNDNAIAWISSSRMIFPPALMSFGVNPDHILFINLKKEKDLLWVMEEALKCNALAAVVGEIQELSFTNSRRLQLSVEESRVTGFVIRRTPRKLNTTACVTRWKISSLPGESAGDFPGVGFPRWKVELLKVRNGKPGCWDLGWKNGSFCYDDWMPAITEVHRKTG